MRRVWSVLLNIALGIAIGWAVANAVLRGGDLVFMGIMIFAIGTLGVVMAVMVSHD